MFSSKSLCPTLFICSWSSRVGSWQSSLLKQGKMVSFSTHLSWDLVDPPDSDAHLLCYNNHASHLQHCSGRPNCWKFQAFACFEKSPKNELLKRSPLEPKSLQNVPFCNKYVIVKRFLLLRILEDVFKDRVTSAVERGPNRRVGLLVRNRW